MRYEHLMLAILSLEEERGGNYHRIMDRLKIADADYYLFSNHDETDRLRSIQHLSIAIAVLSYRLPFDHGGQQTLQGYITALTEVKTQDDFLAIYDAFITFVLKNSKDVI